MSFISYFDDLFSPIELQQIINNETVIEKRQQLGETTKIRFSITIPEDIQTKLQILGLSGITTIPMMWTSADSLPHVDSGEGEFQNTILVYVSDSYGNIIIDGNSYEIKKNRAFKFQKGLQHYTENTGNEPRLLIGPLNESGNPVGTGLYYFANYNDVFPEPNWSSIVYSPGYPDYFTISTTTQFPDNSSIPPPYPGATLLQWAGQKGFTANYTNVVYNPGDTWTQDANTFLYPVWSQQQIMCFKEGTKILCLDGDTEKYIPIQKLQKGILVKTLSSGYKPICMIGNSKIYNPANDLRYKNRLYICKKTNYPEILNDLIITGCHSILVPSLTDFQREHIEDLMGKIYVTENRYRLLACADERAEPYNEEGIFTIWHFALEHEHIRANYGVYANGLLVETSSKRMMSEYSGMVLQG